MYGQLFFICPFALRRNAIIIVSRASAPPQGVHYDYKPEALRERFANEEQAKQFIEFCFEDGSPMNEKLKEALAGMITGGEADCKNNKSC
jgi:hypothetical protein